MTPCNPWKVLITSAHSLTRRRQRWVKRVKHGFINYLLSVPAKILKRDTAAAVTNVTSMIRASTMFRKQRRATQNTWTATQGQWQDDDRGSLDHWTERRNWWELIERKEACVRSIAWTFGSERSSLLLEERCHVTNSGVKKEKKLFPALSRLFYKIAHRLTNNSNNS